ncbi:RNA-binding protein 8A [Globomyces pollinis-pini]|nr:RNA-binding protein 8A [Globomyces pollinis-pini]
MANNQNYEITLDLDAGADAVEDIMMDEDVNSKAKRKGRGFNQARDRGDHFKDAHFDKVESSGTAQQSVEGWIVVVTNIHEELNEDDIIEKFGDFGPIKNLHLNLDRRTGYVKGYALIEYSTYEEASAAISEMNGQKMQDLTLKCDFAFVRGASNASSVQQMPKRRQRG